MVCLQGSTTKRWNCGAINDTIWKTQITEEKCWMDFTKHAIFFYSSVFKCTHFHASLNLKRQVKSAVSFANGIALQLEVQISNIKSISGRFLGWGVNQTSWARMKWRRKASAEKKSPAFERETVIFVKLTDGIKAVRSTSSRYNLLENIDIK